MKRLIAIALLSLASPLVAAPIGPETPDAQLHNDLRAMKDRMVAALNSRKPDALLAEVDPDIRLTTMDNVVSKGPTGIKSYYDKMMSGASRVVEDMKLTAEPDDLSVLYANKAVAISTGTANAKFKLASGNDLEVPLRWTATSVNRNGTWKVASAQFSANMFENPVLSAASGFAKWGVAIAGFVGLLLGWLLGRRKRAA